jgi:hypothetical protein
MAGETIKKTPVDKGFKPNERIDVNRTSTEKKAHWREAEAEVYGEDFVEKQEQRIQEGKLMDKEIRDKLIKSKGNE